MLMTQGRLKPNNSAHDTKAAEAKQKLFTLAIDFGPFKVDKRVGMEHFSRRR